jgi:hypothetical protein
MNISKVSVTRKFFLGNFETLDMSAEADITLPNENFKQVLGELREAIEMEYIDMQRVKPTQTQQTKMPAQMANEHTAMKKQTAQADPTKCPKCGANKKPQYDLCYLCFEEEKAA